MERRKAEKVSECLRVDNKDAAAEIGCAKQYMFERMRKGDWDLGAVVKPKTRNGRHSYFVFRGKLDKFLENPPWPVQ